MSRPQTHRKSQSTSALSIIASSPNRPSKISREKARGGLERIEEGPAVHRRDSGDRRGESHTVQGHQNGQAGSTPNGTPGRGNAGKTATIADMKGWMNDVLSIRASSSRRLVALQNMEECLLRCCLRGTTGQVDMAELLALNVHTSLLILLTRHSQLLTSRAHSHSSLHSSDEVAIGLVPELTAVFGLLQGLCLLSATCKAACAEDWSIEMLIDLLLLLRSIPATADTDGGPNRPVVYFILELLFCMLVDSPEYSRRFERLSGLEAVTRVLKGSSVSKDVRMKCIEFLYFYLLPEHQSRSLSSSTRSASSTSTSTSTSSSDSLYPPSPLDRSSLPRQSPLIVQPQSPKRTDDLDLNFVPQTPRKKVTPNLGYLTPSSRRVSGGSSAKSTPALQTVPASPIESGNTTPKASAPRRESGDAEVGLGLGLPNANGGGMKRDVTAIHLGTIVDSPESSSSSKPRDSQHSHPLPRSPTSGKMSRSSTQPNISGLPPTQRQTSLSVRKPSRSPLVQSSIPESPKAGESSEGERARRRQSRTSLYPSDTDGPSGASDSGQSRMRHSRTSSQLSLHSDSPSAPPPAPRTPRIRHSMTSSHLSASTSEIPPPTPSLPKSPRVRHSRTSSHLSALPADAPAHPNQMSRSPSGFLIPRTPSGGDRSTSTGRTPSALLSPAPSHSRVSSAGDDGGVERTPSKARRAFPSELTRGLLPPPSSPKPTPLGHSRRLPSTSDRRSSLAPGIGGSGSEKAGGREEVAGVRSVEEKKQLLGQWLGNVDALVSGVEGAGWWGAQGKGK